MNKINFIFIAILPIMILFFSCSEKDELPKERFMPELKAHFDADSVVGSFVLYNSNNNSFIYYDKARCETRFSPASTFKIPNTMFALESGVMTSGDDTLTVNEMTTLFDYKQSSMTLSQAFEESAVWFYQEIARRIGIDTMKVYLDSLDMYGTMVRSGDIDRFWLDGSLVISQAEQIEFLRALYYDSLSFSKRSQQMTKELMPKDTGSNYLIYAKTGASTLQGIGWWVGWLSKEGEKPYFFAINIKTEGDVMEEKFLKSRKRITKKIFKELGIIEN